MSKAEKLKSGNWRAKAYMGTDENGKKIFQSFTASTKKEAEYLAAEAVLKKKEKVKNMTVGEAIDKYIAIKENILSPTTIAGYKKIRRNNLQMLMDIPIQKLTQEIVQKAVNDDSKKLSAKTITSAHGLVSAAMAVYNPDFHLHTTLPRIQKKYKDLPEPAEIIKAVEGTEIELPVLLGLCLGMRMSEIRGIRKKDIIENCLTIQNVMVTADGKNIAKEQTKTNNSARKLKLPEKIVELIAQSDAKNDEDYIIKMSGQAIYKRFMRMIEKSGLKKMTFHDLRHINASVMLQLGIPDKYAMERGGWSTNSTLKAVYQHTFSEERELIDSKIDNFFENVCNTKCNTKNE